MKQQQLEYLADKNSLFARATKGSVIQAVTLQRLHGMVRVIFQTACVGVSDGNYVIALNVPWLWYMMNQRRIRDIKALALPWLKQHDPDAKALKIQRTAKGLEREQVALSWDHASPPAGQ
jgi:hypothetical protein